jgi:hypothetical protein
VEVVATFATMILKTGILDWYGNGSEGSGGWLLVKISVLMGKRGVSASVDVEF